MARPLRLAVKLLRGGFRRFGCLALFERAEGQDGVEASEGEGVGEG